MRRWGFAVAGMALLCGCSGVAERDLARLQVGRTTAAEAIRMLGTPDRDEVLGDGSRMLTYIVSSAHTRPANFVPGLTYVWGGWSVTSAEAGLMFAPDGTLRFHSWSSEDQILVKAVGRDTVPAQLSDPHPEAENQTPPPVSGKGG